MGAQRTSFAKRERDRAKQAKAAAKRARRQGKEMPQAQTEEAPAPMSSNGGGQLAPDELLARIENIQKRRAAGLLTDEEFEDEKAELMARLPSD